MNKLFIVSGPSGSGKTSTMRSIMDNEVVSFTTRSPREGEIDGKDYHFISESEFDYLLSTNGLAEYTEYFGGAKYGIVMSELQSKLGKGDAFVVVDYIGKQQLEAIHPSTTSIFIFTTPEEARIRMEKRGDSQESINKRLASFGKELLNVNSYDFCIYNQDGKMSRTIEKVREFMGYGSL